MTLVEYVASLPLVRTDSLPLKALFWADRIYEVVEVDSSGYSRGRQWRQDESTDVALIPGSRLAARLKVIDRGRLLPQIQSREEFLRNGRHVSFVFPVEQNALDAAYLDVALSGQGSGLYARRYDRYPAFEMTNGVSVLRRYYFSRTRQNMDTNLASIKPRLDDDLVSHLKGPMYWRLLPSWDESPYDLTQTMVFRAGTLADRLKALEDTSPGSSDEDTWTSRPREDQERGAD